LAPHVIWLVANAFAPVSYAAAVHSNGSTAANAMAALSYIAGAIGYLAGPLAILFLRMRPGMAAVADSAWPATAERRTVAIAFWATLLLPAVLGIVAGFQVTSLWTMSAWTLLPVMLLGSRAIVPTQSDVAFAVAVAVAFPLVMLASAPVIAFTIQRMGQISPAATYSALLARSVERLWSETTSRPLRLFASVGEFPVTVAFYLPGHPTFWQPVDYQRLDPAARDERIARDGIVVACPADDTACITLATAIERQNAASRRNEIETVRSYWGARRDMRFLIITVTPVDNPGAT
jgi:hypothetical protein